jgi:hypothetical protein
MVCRKACAVRAATLRRSAFIFANTCSIGLKSGEYGGRSQTCAGRLDGFAYAADLVAAEIVHDHDLREARKVADIIRGQFHSDDFMRAGINAEVQLAPPAARPDTMLLMKPMSRISISPTTSVSKNPIPFSE